MQSLSNVTHSYIQCDQVNPNSMKVGSNPKINPELRARDAEAKQFWSATGWVTITWSVMTDEALSQTAK